MMRESQSKDIIPLHRDLGLNKKRISLPSQLKLALQSNPQLPILENGAMKQDILVYLPPLQ